MFLKFEHDGPLYDDKLRRSGVDPFCWYRVVEKMSFCKSIQSLRSHFADMMVVRCMTKFELRRLCKAVGATAIARLGAPTAEEYGYCTTAKTTEIGDTNVTVFVNSMYRRSLCNLPGVGCFVVPASVDRHYI